MLEGITSVIARMPYPFGFADEALVTEQARTESAVIAKPKMRRLLAAQIRRNIFVGVCLSLASGLIFKITVADVRRQKYADFYRTYDAEKEFEEMRKKGVFQAC